MSDAPEWPKVAQEHISALLRELGVERVILVDDEVEKVTSSIVIAAKLPRLGDATWDSKEDYETFFKREWKRLTGEQQRKAQDRAVRKRPNLASPGIDVMRVIFDNVKWSAIDPESWRAEQHIDASDIGKTLVFFDLDLRSKGGRNGGATLLGQYLDLHPDARAVLLTSTISADNELKVPEVAAKEVGRPAGEIMLASKDHLTQPRSVEFPDLVRRSLTLESLRTIREQVTKALKGAHLEALQSFEELPLRAVEDIVVRASRSEGVWEIDTYLRVFGIFQRAALYRKVVDHHDQKLRQAIAAARGAARIVPHTNYGPSKRLVIELMAAENYASGSLINEAGLPVENGDIFEVANALYVLAMQPCDLMFRDDGSGVRDDTVLARLLPVSWSAKGTARGRRMKLPPGLSPAIDANAARSEATGAYIAGFAAVRHLSLELLDLCSFDSKGQARLDSRLSGPPIPSLTPGQHKRYEDLLGKVIKSSRSRIRSKGSGRLHLSADGDLDLRSKWSSRANILSFDLRRVARLATAHSAQLLIAFAHDASRAADAPPLDRFPG